MKSGEKKMIIVIIVIGLIVIGGILIAKNRQNNEDVGEGENVIVEEFVEVLEDGTRLNTSNKLSETKTFDGLEISNFQVTEKNNVTVLLATITNKTSSVKGDYPISLILKDKNGNEIVEVGGYIGEIQPGGTQQLNCSASFDYANAYDFEIRKK